MTYYNCNCNTQKLIGIFAALLIALGVLLATSDVLVIFNGEPTLVSQSVSSDQHCSEYKEQLIRLKAQIYDLQQQLGSTSRQQQDDSRDLPTFALRSSTTRLQSPLTSQNQLKLSSKTFTATHHRLLPTTTSPTPTTQTSSNPSSAKPKPSKPWAARDAAFLQLLCNATRPATCAGGGGGGKLRFVTCTGLGGLSDQRKCLARSFQLAWMLNLTVVVPPVLVLPKHNPTFAK
jgi:hypothetical protein